MWPNSLLRVDDGGGDGEVDDDGGDGDIERWRDGEESPPFSPIKFCVTAQKCPVLDLMPLLF